MSKQHTIGFDNLSDILHTAHPNALKDNLTAEVGTHLENVSTLFREALTDFVSDAENRIADIDVEIRELSKAKGELTQRLEVVKEIILERD